VNSVKLCQVGIEHRHKVQLEELCCEFRRENRITEDSVKLCQVGIEQCKECTEEELCCEFRRRSRITEDSESSARWASSKCIGAQEKKTELLKFCGRRNSARWALRHVQIGTEEKRTL
jgi:hypothetical protein